MSLILFYYLFQTAPLCLLGKSSIVVCLQPSGFILVRIFNNLKHLDRYEVTSVDVISIAVIC